MFRNLQKMTDLESLSDEQLAALASLNLEASQKAEEILLRRYKDMVRQVSRRYYIEGGDREDVIQEGMIGVMKAIRGFDPDAGASFGSFARLCVSRQIVSAIRRATRKKNAILSESISLNGSADPENERGLTLEETIAAADSDPAVQVFLNDLERFLQNDGNSLFSPLESEVWEEMRAGGTSREIAERLGRPVKVVDNTIQRVRRKIHRCLQEGRM
ncbi:MAG: sigma-70 family RNA polymerase sigma factor [Clostridiales bacterium]|jgi:RNA polymerase sporulation-specific sigma factor|nr:sigma-70 family RNA polymerase sigma factor [Clostridiales bacterium]